MSADRVERPFLDTNILVYAATNDPRSTIAEPLLAGGFHTSVQALNEFASVARRKLGMSWGEVMEAIGSIRILARSIQPVDLAVHDKAVELAMRHGLAIYDGLIVAAALQGGCTVLHSEDMHHGLLIEGRLLINNPFV